MYDCFIIGGGIAGLTAAIYAARAGLKTAVAESLQCGGQSLFAHEIENYPGFSGSGAELAEKVREQAETAGAKILYDEITQVSLSGDIKEIQGEEATYKSRTLIIAVGASHKRAGFKGEEEFAGRGVSYCALCDGSFFEGRDVCVIGGANSAVSEALYLSEICRRVYIIYRRNKLRAERVIAERAEKADNIEILYNTEVKEVCGKDLAEKVITDRGELNVNGIFVSVGQKPHTEIFGGCFDLDDEGYIKTKQGLETSVNGVFAAGDCRVKSLRQLITAAADGALAAEGVIRLLRS